MFELLFSISEEKGDTEYSFELAKKNALKHFVHNQADNIFVIEVKSILKLNMVNNFVYVGVSFRQASMLYQSVKEETGMGVMVFISDVEVAQQCRIVCVVNLHYLLKCLCLTVFVFLGHSYLDLSF